ncbi:hypothetical protein Bbelb_057740 [Branchiostoma belcheri]|nr:hypothetical protein Bbelb_057740 [Branchiostoma belcheri]
MTIRTNQFCHVPSVAAVPPGGEPEIVTFDDIMGPAEDAESRPSVLPPVVSKAPPGGDAVATKLPDVRPTETLGQDVKKGRGGRGRGKGRDPPRLNGAQDVPTSDLEDFLGMRLPHNTTDVSCELHDDCFEGECCNANKGKCVAYKQEQGQRCKDSCMCRKGLRCFVRKAKKMVKTGKIRGQCMNPDDPDLPKGARQMEVVMQDISRVQNSSSAEVAWTSRHSSGLHRPSPGLCLMF